MARTKLNAIQVNTSQVPRPTISLGEDLLTSSVGGSAAGTIMSGTLTVPAELAGMTLDFDFFANNAYGSIANDYFNIIINLDGSAINQARFYSNGAAAGQQTAVKVAALKQNITSGSHTYSVTYTRLAGSGTLSIEGAAAFPILLKKNLR